MKEVAPPATFFGYMSGIFTIAWVYYIHMEVDNHAEKI